MANSDAEAVRSETDQYSLYFIIAGISVGIATFVQVSQQQVIIKKNVWFPCQTHQCISLLQVLFL